MKHLVDAPSLVRYSRGMAVLATRMAMHNGRSLLKSVPGVTQFMRSRAGESLRYRFALMFEKREPFTFTQFRRLPSQFAALTGPVLEFLRARPHGTPIRIVVVGCSNGAEPFSISSELLITAPDLPVEIEGYDIDRAELAIAESGTYAASAVLGNLRTIPAFVEATFDHMGDRLVVKPRVRGRVRFFHSDLLDPAQVARIERADIVFAQNVMCNMARPVARRFFDAAVSLMKPRAVLFVDGADLDIRASRTRRHGLEPLSHLLEPIHEEARIVRGPRYPWLAAGLEPFAADRSDVVRRYSTIYVRGGP